MKTFSNLVLGSVAILLAASPVRAAEIVWSAFTGGGGIAQHGAVALGGAIGPIAPALSPATGGDVALFGGFWSALNGQPQPAWPVLKIRHLSGNQVRLSWPVTVNGFVLEYTTQLGSGVWHAENTAVVDTAGEHTVTVPASVPVQAWRLRAP
jgi:hypothetical protein